MSAVRSPWLVGLATALAACLILLGQSARHGFDPTTWIAAGHDNAAVDRVPDGAVRVPDTGYDGQFYFALARDPLVIDPATEAALDTPVYRAQRVLLPALTWAVSGGGNPVAAAWAMGIINMIALGLLSAVIGLFAIRAGVSAWFGLAVGLLPGLVMAAVRDLTEPVALATLAGALWLREHAPPWAYGSALALAMLGRESLAVIVVALLVLDAVRRQPGRALAAGGALTAFALWQTWLTVHLGEPGIMASGPGT